MNPVPEKSSVSFDTMISTQTVNKDPLPSSPKNSKPLLPNVYEPRTPPQRAKDLLSLRSSSNGNLTYAAQNNLPRLPIPSLGETLAKLPRVLEAIQTEEEQEQTKKDIEEFLNGPGQELQEALIEYEREGVASGRIGSYVEEFWNESYLSPDASVVLNLNPFFILEDGPDPKIAKDQLRRAASLCFASLKLASQLRHETLAPDIFKGNALCMDQFKVLFGASRQPVKHNGGNDCDDVHVYGDSCHVVVLCRNQFYYFPALWPDSGEVAVDETDLLDILRAIRRHAKETDETEACKKALGIFTSLPRSEWAVAREELCKCETNESALHVIDSALFILVLDDYCAPDIHRAAANMLHGTNRLAKEDTLQVGTCLNRWYDKLQLIVCKDGMCGVNFEHSSIDGHTALRFVSDVFAETVIAFADSIVDVIHGHGRITHVLNATVKRAANCLDRSGRPRLDVFPKKLLFDISEDILTRIYYAETALSDELDGSDTYVLEFQDYGKKLIVGNKLSPDSFVQMSILLAYYKLYGKVVCMYEPVLTKSFYHGRTEAMRTATPEAKVLCEVWCNKNSTPEQKLAALRTATEEHSRLVKESAYGKGVDRHLFSLKCIAIRKGLPVPKFFESKAWTMLNHTVLSTSNCGNPALRFFGFGPVVPDGFGVGYIIKDHGLSYSVSSKHRQTSRYVRSLRTTLTEMKELLRPLSSIEVSNRAPLAAVKQVSFSDSPRVSGYGDIWGETELEGNQEIKPKRPRSASRGKFFSQVQQRSESFTLLEIPDIRIDVELETDDSSTGSSSDHRNDDTSSNHQSS